MTKINGKTVDKKYTIRYSKGGVLQYADFMYTNGKLIYNSFHPSWVKLDEVPSLEGLNEIEDILKVIKEFSYSNRAEIYLINDCPIEYDNSIDISLGSASETYNKFLENLTLDFFKKELLPIIRKKRWKIAQSWIGIPILVKKVKKEWDNVDSNDKDYQLLNFICHRFITWVLGVEHDMNLQSEQGYVSSNAFPLFIKYIPDEELTKLNLLLDNESL